MIEQVIHRYHPSWKPPRKREGWVKTLCPFHGETNPSAVVSYEADAFKCFSCGVSGDAIALIKRIEEVDYREAFRIAKALSSGGYEPVSQRASRKQGRRLFSDQGTDLPEYRGQSRKPKARVRRRTFGGA